MDSIKEIKIPVEQLEFEAKSLNIHDLRLKINIEIKINILFYYSDFLKSELFSSTYELRGQVIIRSFNL